jgi:hypothetical protein
MRIGDAVSLTADRIEGNRLFLYTQKTGVPVNTVLPDFVLKALDATPRVTDKHFFWDGRLKLETVVGSWRKSLVRLFELAKVENGHPHRFRDTFAVELLLTGVPIERVSVLLGHQSVRITERHYASWVRSRQEPLEADLVNAWSHDPVIAAQTQGTPQVHGKKYRSNSKILKRLKVGGAGGIRTLMTTENAQVIHSTFRSIRKNRQKRMSEVHGGYATTFGSEYITKPTRSMEPTPSSNQTKPS